MWGELPSQDRGEVGLEWWFEKEACLGGGRPAWAGSLGRSTLRLLKSSPGGITLISGIMRPARRRALSTASSFTSYLQPTQPSAHRKLHTAEPLCSALPLRPLTASRMSHLVDKRLLLGAQFKTLRGTSGPS